MLIKPIEPDLADKSVIAFIPNQLLYYLPMQALAKKQGNTLHYLIEDKQIVYLTAADVMNVVQPPATAKLRTGMVAFGDPTGADLPHALEEVKNIAKVFPATQVLTGAEVTKSSVTGQAMLHQRIVHFATHGILDSESTRPELH